VLDLLAANPKLEANVETKSNPKHPELTPAPAEFVKMIVDAIRRHHIDESRIILQSFDFRTLTEMRKIAPKIRLSALISKPPEGLDDQSKVFVSVHETTGAEIISPAFKMVTPENVAAAHKVGVQIVPWTPDNPEEWKAMADAHVDAVITDDPAGLYVWLKAQKPTLH
jgi:glycerophosphoryl diester phosphodiesterase